jgi:hypothetical protein
VESSGGFAGFGMGLTLADFQAVGKYPNIRIWLKRRVTYSTSNTKYKHIKYPCTLLLQKESFFLHVLKTVLK